jgi:hypothetical protein
MTPFALTDVKGWLACCPRQRSSHFECSRLGLSPGRYQCQLPDGVEDGGTDSVDNQADDRKVKSPTELLDFLGTSCFFRVEVRGRKARPTDARASMRLRMLASTLGLNFADRLELVFPPDKTRATVQAL